MAKSMTGIEAHQFQTGQGGKPRLIPEGRQKLLTVPMLDSDLLALQAAAKAVGVTAAEYVRWCISQRVSLEVIAAPTGLRKLGKLG